MKTPHHTPTVDTRKTKEAVPDNWRRILTHDQVITITQYENYGWDLWFIRRGRGAKPIPVLRNPSTHEAVVVDEEGDFIRDHGLEIRD